jgi:glycogen phosphorylase
VRMANLAAVGSHAINGVAELQSRLLREHTLRDYAGLWPAKFQNKTNGVTPRRFMRLANPRLADLIRSRIGDDWLRDLEQLRKLEPLADDPDFRRAWLEVKRANKADLAEVVTATGGPALDPDSLFDVMVKRLHEYKRQLLKACTSSRSTSASKPTPPWRSSLAPFCLAPRPPPATTWPSSSSS